MKKFLSICVIFLTVFMFFSLSAEEKKKDFELSSRGCCSRHGGVEACIDGKVKCKNGTFSPGCTCKKK